MDLSARPMERWIAPEWPPGAYSQERYFREHPAGLFVPAALLARLGYPAPQAAFAANLLYQALTLVLLARLAGALAGEREARALAWILQLLPLAFAYRVRANHEQPLVMCLAAALLGLEYARRDPRWSLLTVAGLLGLLLVKGVLAAPAFLIGVVWVALRPGRWSWIALALSAAAAIAAVAAYEAAYLGVTGESFLATYLGRQMLTGHVRNPLDRLGGYAYAFVWYFARVVWFAFPWSLLALASLPRLVTGRAPGANGGWIALATTAIYLLLFSASERRAERYLFPAYYAVAMAGALAAGGRFPRFARLVEKADRLGPWAAPGLFLLLFALHLAGGWLNLPRIKVWAPDR